MEDRSEQDTFESLNDALKYVGLTSGLFINETLLLPRSQSKWPSAISILPLILGFIGLVFNILALLIFTASRTFRQNSFRWYIYALTLINCASILTHSWLYLIFYIADSLYLCKYLRYLQQSTATTSLWIMVLLSLERSFTFSRPFVVKKFLQSHTICFILLFVTCLCFALHIDELISVDVKAFRWVNFAYGLCSVKRHFRLSTDRIKIVTHSHSFILPFLLNSILDIYICYKMCQRRKRLITKSSLSFNHHKNRFQRSRKSAAHEITLTLLCQSMWLLFTYFPTHLYYFLLSFKLINDHDRDNSTLNFLMRQNLLIYLAFSPTLYVILSSTLRREIYSCICRSYKRHRPSSLSNMSSVQSRFRQFFLHSEQQRQSIQRPHLVTFVTMSERIPRKAVSQSICVPFKIKNISNSAPSLLTMYKYRNDANQNQKTERSNTMDQ
ncbi:unnamed protein product [Adineta steineri]|uniref:G-protein coupled receptors family 1 profile domain-containing protein n=1 Tax=Adineta steineri TaxID=433720 RepID=A0A819N4K9_9BILA|nr:unnamed protein product [Adineta steineri]CAF3989997.1 unnamed protein product [Adineta steineri]